MVNIQVLDISVANLIAAGEVVDRPASVVKELLENAIDATSTMITVEIKRGGVTYIRVSDNGCGIHRDDLPVALQRHATSKIRCAADLDSILTLGFRGEALAAISAVSVVRILTKRAEDKAGSYLLARQGIVEEFGESACSNGTTVTVEELFANVPARRKFLKSDMAETMAVSATVEKIALSHPEISIRFIVDNNLKFSTSGDGKMQNTIYAVLGREFAKRLIPIDHKTDGVSVCGFVGAPDQVKSNRNYENFFINGRYIKSRTAFAALEQAFQSYIPGEKFPCCVLNIYVHPTFVDVNVHPTKLEVKFSNERMVFDAIYSAVKSALMQKIERPELQFGTSSQINVEETKYTNAFVPIYEKIQRDATDEELLKQLKLEDTIPQIVTPSDVVNPVPSPNTQNYTQQTPTTTEAVVDIATHTNVAPTFSDPIAPHLYDTLLSTLSTASNPISTEPKVQEKPAMVSAPVARKRVTPPSFQILGVAFESYVFVEVEQKVLVIDKHAAHERILFEQLKENIALDKPDAQMLFVPIVIELDSQEFAVACDDQAEIQKLGFAYNTNARRHTISITEIPLSLKEDQAKTLLLELLSKMQAGTGNIPLSKEVLYEKALYQASCKAAVKAGRIDDIEHIRWICQELLSLPDIKYCPHGRPVAFELSRQNLEHQFKRS